MNPNFEYDKVQDSYSELFKTTHIKVYVTINKNCPIKVIYTF